MLSWHFFFCAVAVAAAFAYTAPEQKGATGVWRCSPANFQRRAPCQYKNIHNTQHTKPPPSMGRRSILCEPRIQWVCMRSESWGSLQCFIAWISVRNSVERMCIQQQYPFAKDAFLAFLLVLRQWSSNKQFCLARLSIAHCRFRTRAVSCSNSPLVLSVHGSALRVHWRWIRCLWNMRSPIHTLGQNK